MALTSNAFAIAVVSVALACGNSSGDDNTQPDASNVNDAASEPDATFAAPHSSMPQVVSSGGAVMTAPKLVAISFQADSLQADIDTFASQIAASSYWSGATSEYGVGALTSTTYHAMESAPTSLTDADVQAWLKNKIQTDPTFPQPDANTIFTLFYPSSTTVSSGGGTTCNQFQGYHDSFPLTAQTNVIYAIVPRCPAPPVQGVTITDQMTAEASHELVEAATDPLPGQAPAYITVDSNSHAWELLAGGEIGDMCAAFPDSFYTPTGIDHLVQRVWSNAAAAANHDPCEPNGSSPYFNSAPALSDTITVDVSGQSVKTQGVKLPVGQSATIELDLYSDMPTSGPWAVSVIDVTSEFFGGTAALSFTLDKTSGQNGDKIMLTIKSLRAVAGGALFWIENDLGSVSTVWLGAVSSQ